ncbi:MAG: hypothetical protein LBQ63_06485 [Deltaproteobacteria bacterium]|nr:hypothetical protein [Deltaproteobacteria bacterium]
MKIQNDPLQALSGQGEAQRKTGGGTEEFEALLAKELRQSQESHAGGLTRSPGQEAAALAMRIRAAQEFGVNLESESAVKEDSFERVNALLDKLSLYADSLGRDQSANLKDLHGMLNGVGTEIASLKRDLPPAQEEAALGELLNELEVLAATERFKFDRGDYI